MIGRMMMIKTLAAAVCIAGAPFAASAGSDAETVLSLFGRTEGLVTPGEFEDALGKGRERRSIGADVFRDFVWSFPSEDSPGVSLAFCAGFDYGKAKDRSVAAGFGGAEEARRYFAALCGDMERLTGHISPVLIIDNGPEGETKVTARYPRDGGELLVEIGTSAHAAKVFVTEASPARDARYLVTAARDTKLLDRPAPDAIPIRLLASGHRLISLGRSAVLSLSSDNETEWHRVQDDGGQIGWVLSADLDLSGIRTIDTAFDGL